VEDFWYLLTMVIFVVVAALFIMACDKLIGPDEEAMAEHGRDDVRTEHTKVAA